MVAMKGYVLQHGLDPVYFGSLQGRSVALAKDIKNAEFFINRPLAHWIAQDLNQILGQYWKVIEVTKTE